MKKIKCLWCGRNAEGRKGKKYCDDYCKSMYRHYNFPSMRTKSDKLYYQKEKEYYKKRSKYHYDKNKEKIKIRNLAYVNKRYKEDECFRMKVLLANALRDVIRTYVKTGKIVNRKQKYNIGWKGIIKQLTPFPKDISKYHIDHIIPLSRFDLTNWEQIQLAFAPENHRWLTAEENMKRERMKDKTF